MINLLNSNNVSCGMLIVLAITCILMNYFIFGKYANKFKIRNKIIDKLNLCTLKCKSSSCEKYAKLRDPSYFNDGTTHKNDCFLTGWEISHFIFHMFLGYFYNLYISLGLSIGYELYERIEFGCASYIDLLINFFGFVVGHILRYGIN